ncbi:hypothetical protein NA56DRAFT_663425 [Hyaloscypha hepaticicola]|uniref:Zn(2)-C6 fungal-type domain-containing protein n=1 Tax=Hyaloscypha hepaticicola TaxID=2082293 RepID=A0A2J6PPG3_9HELO|nr:hypothetical protein NA56DRAFT_663425 [Hyaloscypha hepaticicola]
MSRMQDNSSLAPDIIFPSPMLALQHIAPSPRNQYGNDYSGYRQPQQALLVPASFSANQNSTKRSQRTGPLSVSGKMKAAAVRKKRACFRCGLLKTSCDEDRPCSECKKAAKPSSRTRKLRWMKCIVHTVSTYSIYTPDSDMSQSLTPVFLHTLESMLEQIRLPSLLSTPINLDFLAAEYANWISHTTPSMPTSKLGLLCTPAFQSVAGGGLGDSFVKNFRLLLWITSLLYIAMNGEVDPQDAPAHEAALRNLKKLINACGKRVVLRLDELCHPGAINNMPYLQGLVLAPLRPGCTFLILPLEAGPILALTRFRREPFLDLHSLICT